MAVHVVTGAFGFSGRAIAARLLDQGHTVRTLTNSPGRPHPFGDRVQVFPLDFTDLAALEKALDGLKHSTTHTGSGSTTGASATPRRWTTRSGSSRRLGAAVFAA